MKYDYMNKERPNIYHPSRAGARAEPSINGGFGSVDGGVGVGVGNRSSKCNDDGESVTLHNSSESTPPADDNHSVDSVHDDDVDDDNHTEIFNINHDDGCNNDELLYNGGNGGGERRDRRLSELGTELNSRKVPTATVAAKKQMPSIEEQLNDAVRSLNEHQQMQTMANRRSQTALKLYATSNGLGSIIEKLSVDDSDTNASLIVESPFKKPQVIVKNSGLDANAKNVPSLNIRHEIQDSHVQQKKPMAINTRNNIRPEENWRYRSTSNSLENKQPTSEFNILIVHFQSLSTFFCFSDEFI